MNSRRNFNIYIYIYCENIRKVQVYLFRVFFFLIIKINGDSGKAYSIIHDTCNMRVAQVLVLF